MTIPESLPAGWTVSRMKELGEFSGGSTPSTADPTLWGGDIHWLVPSELSGIQESQTYLFETQSRLTQKGYESCSTQLLPVGTVAVSSRATVGDCIILGREICTNQGFVNIVCNAKMNNLFLLYWLRHNKRELLRYAAGTTFDEIGRRTFKKVRVLHPVEPKDQQAIAEAILAVDSAIAAVQESIAKAEHFQRGLMQQLLTGSLKPDGTMRSSHDFTPDKDFAQIPKSWRSCRFKDLLREGAITGIQDGNHGEKHPTQDDYVTEGIPFIMACDISSGEVDLENAKKIPQQLADSLRTGFSIKDDVLLSHKASIGFTALVGEVDPYIMLTPQVTYYRCNPERLLPRFLNLFFRSFRFQRVLDALSAQSTRSYIGITNQKGLPILYPPDVEEQRAIADPLSRVDDLIRTKRRKIAVLQRLKKSLMQNLLTGTMRLPAKGDAKETTA